MKKIHLTTLQKILLLISVVAIFLIAKGLYFRYQSTQTIIEECTEIMHDQGLKDVSIKVKGKVSGYEIYNIEIHSSNFNESEFTFSEMIKAEKSRSKCSISILTKFITNGDVYTIYTSSSNSIYKNGKTIYDDYDKSTASSGTSKSDNYITVTNDSELATCWALAEKVVKSNLKSPSSAKFPFSYGSDGVKIVKSGSEYIVTAWVEADNSFGANIRSAFVVTITKEGTKFISTGCIID